METAASDHHHAPVLTKSLLANLSPVRGHWLDGTLGAGGHSRALLMAGAEKVTGMDRDSTALRLAAIWARPFGDRVKLVGDRFSNMESYESGLDGVLFDLGVSSMQLDQASRGFSFTNDGPLDMRMDGEGMSAADLVNTASRKSLADILFLYGEERLARRISRAITERRAIRPIVSTVELADIIGQCLPAPRPGRSHAATRSFQALRVAVNNEYEELASGLEAAERTLKPGGFLAVITFHSIEDRIVKRYLQIGSGMRRGVSRHLPETSCSSPRYALKTRRAIIPEKSEVARNPRARSAKLRIAMRTDASAVKIDRNAIGIPVLREAR
ncbi:MAG: 16S rRNA (cytosine(1402)-N(4))-methyltransferase RsmH [Roseovarius sp.]|nr:16S rRNA (cytosine(1402)-N(4))-methyltransferase RsmH [Roseovarius sp.]MCY4314774.1 16S rRNA (cytosine(1402)-N(4))-methyltransferase RsmH [Roseovarius sp.]